MVEIGDCAVVRGGRELPLVEPSYIFGSIEESTKNLASQSYF
jgi:hypothetical protein